MATFVQRGSACISYQVDGNGDGLVLVSGTGGDLHSNWDHLIDHFAARRKVVRVDYSGAGATQDDGGPLRVEQLAEQVLAGADAATLDSFDLVGYSLGAAVAVYIAANYPERVRSLVLLAGFAYGGHSRLALQSQLWLDLIRTDPRQFARLVLLTGFTPGFLNNLSAQDIEQWIQAICSSNSWDGIARQIELDRCLDVRGCLEAIGQPTLVIGCANDCMVPAEHAKELAAAIRGARYVELASGHLAPFECPGEFAGLVTDFIGRQHPVQGASL